MPDGGEFRYDAATAISQGARERQEDAAIADFPVGPGMGFAVLADGMGGHAAGDVASKIVVTEVFSELKLQSGNTLALEQGITRILHDAVHGANACVGQYSAQHSDSASMGATLLAPVFIADRLFWISVGDSPLFLIRNRVLTRLNAEHAIGSQMDYLVRNGLMQPDEVLNYPDQNCLTSVIGGGVIAQIDCPTTPLRLRDGDILVAASDGLLTLTEDEITKAVCDTRTLPACEIGDALLHAIEDLADPNQDNVTICVIKVRNLAANAGRGAVARSVLPRPLMDHAARSAGAGR
ncbi:PP2C family protein-serine/threonine phosphatase [Thalassovita sp.]|uniref:PP2C family protein-serine/threonine phosphatase n=1 Tax=Thalassovita sp. TaxID=1979401 RepID=UPI0029DE646F|nr:protein phosphatase 2C domain-containing protein [Thalassovita sp.]